MRKLFTILTVAVSFFAIESAEAATMENNHNHENETMAVDSKTKRVSAGEIEYFTYHATAGVEASILIVGDGDTDLDLYVFDSDVNLIDEDTDNLDVCVCRWTPKYTGDYYVAVKNWGNVYNEFTIIAE